MILRKQTSAVILDKSIHRIVVQFDIVQIDGKAEHRLDTGHPVVGLPDHDRLPREQPVQLVAEPRTTLPLGPGFCPIALPAHDLRCVDEQVPVEPDQQRAVSPDDVGQVLLPQASRMVVLRSQCDWFRVMYHISAFCHAARTSCANEV